VLGYFDIATASGTPRASTQARIVLEPQALLPVPRPAPNRRRPDVARAAETPAALRKTFTEADVEMLLRR
jgi:hypothetical protein